MQVSLRPHAYPAKLRITVQNSRLSTIPNLHYQWLKTRVLHPPRKVPAHTISESRAPGPQ